MDIGLRFLRIPFTETQAIFFCNFELLNIIHNRIVKRNLYLKKKIFYITLISTKYLLQFNNHLHQETIKITYNTTTRKQ